MNFMHVEECKYNDNISTNIQKETRPDNNDCQHLCGGARYSVGAVRMTSQEVGDRRQETGDRCVLASCMCRHRCEGCTLLTTLQP